MEQDLKESLAYYCACSIAFYKYLLVQREFKLKGVQILFYALLKRKRYTLI